MDDVRVTRPYLCIEFSVAVWVASERCTHKLRRSRHILQCSSQALLAKTQPDMQRRAILARKAISLCVSQC